MMATRRLRLWVLPVSLAVAASAFMEPRRVRTFHPRGQLSSRSTVLASGKLLLEVSGLQAEVSEAEKRILKGLDLIVRAGEVHAIMGILEGSVIVFSWPGCLVRLADES